MYVRHKAVHLPEEMVRHIRRVIESRKELGHDSVKGFVEDSVRRRLEAIKQKAQSAEELATLLMEKGLGDRAIAKILQWYEPAEEMET